MKEKVTLEKKIKKIDNENNYTPDSAISRESEIDILEKCIPNMASKIFKKAYADSLAHGNGVFEVIDNIIYQTYANGYKKKIKEIEPLIKMNINKKIMLG